MYRHPYIHIQCSVRVYSGVPPRVWLTWHDSSLEVEFSHSTMRFNRPHDTRTRFTWCHLRSRPRGRAHQRTLAQQTSVVSPIFYSLRHTFRYVYRIQLHVRTLASCTIDLHRKRLRPCNWRHVQQWLVALACCHKFPRCVYTVFFFTLSSSSFLFIRASAERETEMTR